MSVWVGSDPREPAAPVTRTLPANSSGSHELAVPAQEGRGRHEEREPSGQQVGESRQQGAVSGGVAGSWDLATPDRELVA
jgi:hypothetical protein